MSTLLSFTPRALVDQHAALVAWAKANGLEPRDIPDYEPVVITVDHGNVVINYRTYERGQDGRPQEDPARPGCPLTVGRTAPLVWPLSLGLKPAARHQGPPAGQPRAEGTE